MIWVLEIALYQKKPYISEKHKLDGLKFAYTHESWSFEHWYNAICWDESSFEIGKNLR